jgi:LmbE family N-acetylglucosaminyl deacetylase
MYTGKRVLIIAPHPDDETIGVGGTILKYSTQGAEVFKIVPPTPIVSSSG